MITSRPVATYAYTDEEKQQAKSWLSSHGYPPTRAGAEQAYQDYMDGKIDVPEADAYMGKNQKNDIEEKKNSTVKTETKKDKQSKNTNKNSTTKQENSSTEQTNNSTTSAKESRWQLRIVESVFYKSLILPVPLETPSLRAKRPAATVRHPTTGTANL